MIWDKGLVIEPGALTGAQTFGPLKASVGLSVVCTMSRLTAIN